MKREHIIPLLALAALILIPALACAAPAPGAGPASQEGLAMAPLPSAGEAEAFATVLPGTPVATPDAMFFENYGVNPFIDTEDDQLSTFAMDVDTGSYTVARRYVQDGMLPPKDAIRVEEFVNYFDYDYPLPDEGQTFAIHLEGAPSPFGETERYEMMRIGIQGYAVPPEERQDVTLTFVIDVSGSMDREDRLTLVKRALTLLVEELRPTDTVGIVVYGSDARSVLPPTRGDEKDRILSAIYRLNPEDATNAEAGLLLGFRQAEQAYNAETINRVILLSDGVANVGDTGPEAILRTIGEYATRGIYLSTVGFGLGNYNDTLMEQLANQGDGTYAYVDNIREARRIFVEDLSGTLQTIAKDAKVQVDFNPEVVARYRLLGFENRAIADDQFRDDSVDAGEIGAGHSVTALYEIKRHPDAEGLIATVYLRWQDPESDEVSEVSVELHSEQFAPAFTETSPSFQLATIVSEYAEVLRESYWAQENTLAGVQEEAERIGRLFEGNEDVDELVELVGKAADLPTE